jgi:hypothetical protein
MLLVAALLVLGGCVAAAPAIVAVAVPSALAVLVLVLLVRRLAPTPSGELDRRLLRWTLAAFALHLGIGLLISHSNAATTYLGPDAKQYSQGAAQLVQSWSGHGARPTLPAGKEGYFYELGILYYVFGTHPEAGIAFNALLAAALVPLLTDITRRLFGGDAARYTAPIVVLLPGLLIWTAQLLREASVLLLIVAAVDVALRLSAEASARRIALLSFLVAVLFAFRANVAYVLLGGLAVGVIVSKRQIVAGLSLGASVLSLSLLFVLSAGLGYSGYRAAAGADLQKVNSARVDLRTSAASGFGQTSDVSTPARAAAYLPIGLAEFSLGPFPWQVNSVRQLPALLDVAVLWALVPSIRRGLARSRRLHKQAAFVLLVPAAITACMLALLVGNFGTVVRERMQVVVLLVPFISLGLAVRAGPRLSKAEKGVAALPSVG